MGKTTNLNWLAGFSSINSRSPNIRLSQLQQNLTFLQNFRSASVVSAHHSSEGFSWGTWLPCKVQLVVMETAKGKRGLLMKSFGKLNTWPFLQLRGPQNFQEICWFITSFLLTYIHNFCLIYVLPSFPILHVFFSGPWCWSILEGCLQPWSSWEMIQPER